MRRQLFGDYIVTDWTGAGLLLPSIVTGILRTIKQTMVERRLGRMADTDENVRAAASSCACPLVEAAPGPPEAGGL
jgi:hypothetical protein